MPDDNDGRVVVFYDRCVSQTHVRNAIIPEIPFADHLFVNDLFVEEIQRDDVKLFDAVERWRARYYPRHICFFVTCDSGFDPQIEHHPALGTTITFVNCRQVSSVSYYNGLRRMQEDVLQTLRAACNKNSR